MKPKDNTENLTVVSNEFKVGKKLNKFKLFSSSGVSLKRII